VKTQNLLQPDELIEIDIAVDPPAALTSSLTVKTAQWQFWLLRRKVVYSRARFYMRKLAAPPLARGHVDINKSATQNLKILSECLNRAVEIGGRSDGSTAQRFNSRNSSSWSQGEIN